MGLRRRDPSRDFGPRLLQLALDESQAPHEILESRRPIRHRAWPDIPRCGTTTYGHRVDILIAAIIEVRLKHPAGLPSGGHEGAAVARHCSPKETPSHPTAQLRPQ